jgi:hypothetical protein
MLAVIALFVALWMRLGADAWALAPIPLVLLFGFGHHLFGNNLAHAPGFFVGALALVPLALWPMRFASVSRRLSYFAALGALTCYFDLIHGPLLVMLSLGLVIHHFCYARDAAFHSALSQAVAMASAFVVGALLLTALRLSLVILMGDGINYFFRALKFRLGAISDSGVRTDLIENIAAAWNARSQLATGAAGAANWLFLLGAFGWLLAAIAAWPLWRRRELTAVAVLVLAAAGILAWYQVLAGHTHQHILFMVRPSALISAYGMAAALLVAPPLIRSWGYRRCAAAALLCAVVAAAALHRPWMIGNPLSLGPARFIAADADIASCGPLGLRADGAADGIVEFEYELPGRPPLAYLGVPANSEVEIVLLRAWPGGTYHTGDRAFVLAIAERPGGRPLNRADGTFAGRDFGRHRLYGHFCRDGHDQPDTVYRLRVNGVEIEVQPIGGR